MVPAGGWIVQFSALAQAKRAAALHAALTKAGYPAELDAKAQDGRTLHRVRVTGFDTEADARAFAQRVGPRFGVEQPWVTCQGPCSR